MNHWPTPELPGSPAKFHGDVKGRLELEWAAWREWAMSLEAYSDRPPKGKRGSRSLHNGERPSKLEVLSKTKSPQGARGKGRKQAAA